MAFSIYSFTKIRKNRDLPNRAWAGVVSTVYANLAEPHP